MKIAATPLPPDVGNIDFPASKFDASWAQIGPAIITWLGGILGALALVALVYSGFMYITAGGDEAKAENAKKNMIWAITGIVVGLLAWAIISWLQYAATHNAP